MKGKILGLLAVALLAGPMATSASVVVFQQNPFSLVALGGTTSVIATNGAQSLPTYDDFTVTADTSIDQVQWYGFYALDNFPNAPLPGSPTAWRLQLRTDNSGTPGALLAAQAIPVPSVNQTQVGVGNYDGPSSSRGNEVVPVYSYSLDLASALSVNAGQRYWLSIAPEMPFDVYWAWLASDYGQSAESFGFFNGAYFNWGIDASFTLRGTQRVSSVPESSTLGLMALGLAGLGLSRRRKAA